MKNPVIAIPFSYIVITTIVYALLGPILFEMDNAVGKETKFIVDDINPLPNQQIIEVEKKCKSPCPDSAEMCIAMCA